MLPPILLVEDNEDDVIFMSRAFQHADIPNPLHVAKDGQEVLEYLIQAAEVSNRGQSSIPCMILLDLKLPRKGGLEVLEWIRKQPALKTVVVLILSTSKEPHDIERAYQLGANAYLVKPAAVAQLIELVKAIKLFWITFNQFLSPQG